MYISRSGHPAMPLPPRSAAVIMIPDLLSHRRQCEARPGQAERLTKNARVCSNWRERVWRGTWRRGSPIPLHSRDAG